MPRDHALDAGGDPEILAAKAALREECWDALAEARAGRFPGIRHRIPNFTGAERAAERLSGTDVWHAAGLVKANPDAPQWPVRQRVIEDAKTLLMAVPRLAGRHPFLRLGPDVPARTATTIKGAGTYGEPVAVADVTEPVDLVVVGCVAVDASGARLGKGGGFADLELAIAAAAGVVTPDTPVVTTVHPVQVVAEGRIPVTDHDVGVDLVVTPDEIIACPRRRGLPQLRWEELTEEKIAAIPLLQQLATHTGAP